MGCLEGCLGQIGCSTLALGAIFIGLLGLLGVL
jgi:hypothetical protein